MGTGIDGNPNDYDFGLAFNYELWTADTTLTLCNVPWDSDYRNVVNFPNRGALNAYIDSISNSQSRIGNASYAKVNVPVRIGMPFNQAVRYNYLRASNPVQPIPGDTQRDWYYFINDVRYINPSTTELVVQVDVYQSFKYGVSLGTAFVERGHVGIANENNFDNYGRDYLTEPEGFDIGASYRIIAKRDEFIAGTVDMGAPQGTIRQGYSVLALSAVDLNGDAGTEDSPKKPTATGGDLSGIVSGAGVYIWETFSDFNQFLSAFRDKPWITEGILSVSLIPRIDRYTNGPFQKDPETFAVNAVINTAPLKHQMFNAWRNAGEILNNIDPRYRSLRKFLTFPYMLIEATTFSDTPLVLKPEEWPDPNATMVERATFMPPNQRVAFNPLFYNAGENATEDDWTRIPGSSNIGLGDDHGEYMDMTTQITAFPKTAIVNDGAISYLASTVHARNNTRANAYSSRAITQRGASVARQNDIDQQNALSEAQKRQNKFNREQAARDAAQAGDARNIDLLSGGFLNPAGALSSAWQGQHDNRARADNVAASNSLASQQRTADAFTAAGVRDRNSEYAELAAQGDFEATIGSLNAAVQDAEMVAPSTSGQLGGETLMMSQNAMKLSLRFKLIDNAAIRRIGEHWLRYGYAVNQYVNVGDNLMCMTRFTYWKVKNLNITNANIPELYKNALRGIFEKGVTLWADPDRIGNANGNNIVPGVSI